MNKIIGAALVALALALPASAQDEPGSACIAADGGSCSIVAGSESDDIVVEGTTIAGNRGSWIAAGEWTLEVYGNADCTGTPIRTRSSADQNNIVDGVAGSNNGGVYYGLCATATAGPGGLVVLMTGSTDLLP
ncbi:MAG TPA: hypothetical protein VGB64_01870 [Actinomycetota bacterium]